MMNITLNETELTVTLSYNVTVQADERWEDDKDYLIELAMDKISVGDEPSGVTIEDINIINTTQDYED